MHRLIIPYCHVDRYIYMSPILMYFLGIVIAYKIFDTEKQAVFYLILSTVTLLYLIQVVDCSCAWIIKDSTVTTEFNNFLAGKEIPELSKPLDDSSLERLLDPNSGKVVIVKAPGLADSRIHNELSDPLHWQLPDSKQATSTDDIRWIIFTYQYTVSTDMEKEEQVVWKVVLMDTQNDTICWNTTLYGRKIKGIGGGMVPFRQVGRKTQWRPGSISYEIHASDEPRQEFRKFFRFDWEERQKNLKNRYQEYGFWAPEKRIVSWL